MCFVVYLSIHQCSFWNQNKNNITIWFYLYLVTCGYYEGIELNFMIPGHTKFKCDGNFGMIKTL